MGVEGVAEALGYAWDAVNGSVLKSWNTRHDRQDVDDIMTSIAANESVDS